MHINSKIQTRKNIKEIMKDEHQNKIAWKFIIRYLKEASKKNIYLQKQVKKLKTENPKKTILIVSTVE